MIEIDLDSFLQLKMKNIVAATLDLVKKGQTNKIRL